MKSVHGVMLLAAAMFVGCGFGGGKEVVDSPTKANSTKTPSQATGAKADTNSLADILNGHIEQEQIQLASGDAPHRKGDPYRLIGRRYTEWDLGEWENSPPLELADLRGQVVVVRWWTDADEDSRRSLVALGKLADEFAGRGVQFVGVYHSTRTFVDKDWRVAVEQADKWGVEFPIAYDRDQRTLTDWWRRMLRHLPTTPTFVIGTDGRINHVHPGPVFYPTEEPLEQLCNNDYLAIRDAILEALPHNLAEKE